MNRIGIQDGKVNVGDACGYLIFGIRMVKRIQTRVTGRQDE